MFKKWFWGLIVLFLVGGVSVGFLYRRFKFLSESQSKSQPSTPNQAPSAQDSGATVLTFSNPSSEQKELLRSVVLNKLTIKDFTLDAIELGEKSRSVLNLLVSFEYLGELKELTIPIVDSISSNKRGPQGFEEGEDVSVTNLTLEKGGIVNVGFSYIPKETTIAKDELVEFCQKTDYQLCFMYI